ncbi:MAG: hypothetical protein ABS95_03385, partial [Verrucomicrobia bacterium SCN 57-15]
WSWWVRTSAKWPVLQTLALMASFDLTSLAHNSADYLHLLIEAMKLGAYDYLLKPFDIPRLKEIVFAALKAAREMNQVVSYEPLLESEDYEIGVVGRSEAMQKVFKLIGQLASSDATALITGESGTGKELVARAIYHHGQRSDKPFLAINCAAIPENLLESELFGHEKGAFTGANTQRIGKFEQCDGGTIFLDEIGEMSLPTQSKILRVLQNSSFERAGGNQLVKVNVRIIAATNKHLEQAVAAKTFREDLFYRLNVVRIEMPPLRARKADIKLLVNYFLKRYAQGRKTIAPDSLKTLEQYDWPGNVRELENIVQRAIVMTKGIVILPIDLPPEIWQPEVKTTSPSAALQPTAPAQIPNPGATNSTTPFREIAQQLFQLARTQNELAVLPAVERELIREALAQTRGNQVQAAKLLGITRATLRKRVDRFALGQ